MDSALVDIAIAAVGAAIGTIVGAWIASHQIERLEEWRFLRDDLVKLDGLVQESVNWFLEANSFNTYDTEDLIEIRLGTQLNILASRIADRPLQQRVGRLLVKMNDLLKGHGPIDMEVADLLGYINLAGEVSSRTRRIRLQRRVRWQDHSVDDDDMDALSRLDQARRKVVKLLDRSGDSPHSSPGPGSNP